MSFIPLKLRQMSLFTVGLDQRSVSALWSQHVGIGPFSLIVFAVWWSLRLQNASICVLFWAAFCLCIHVWPHPGPLLSSNIQIQSPSLLLSSCPACVCISSVMGSVLYLIALPGLSLPAPPGLSPDWVTSSSCASSAPTRVPCLWPSLPSSSRQCRMLLRFSGLSLLSWNSNLLSKSFLSLFGSGSHLLCS